MVDRLMKQGAACKNDLAESNKPRVKEEMEEKNGDWEAEISRRHIAHIEQELALIE